MPNTIQLPGLIDCHVHFREPGYPEKGTMATEAAAAKAGGVFTVCEMPNTKPPTNSIVALADKVERAEAIEDVSIRFFFSITEPEHMAELERIWTEESAEMKRLKQRCAGIKLFLENSTGNLKTAENVVEQVFEFAGRLNIPIVAHCEDPVMNATAHRVVFDQAQTDTALSDVSLHTLVRPAASEAHSIAYAVKLAKKYNTQFHVAHLSTAPGLEEVRKAKADGVNVTCEVAPHHLFLSTDDYVHLGTFGKMNPPLRTPENPPALWAGILDGTVDCIATDHAPHTIAEKQCDNVFEAPSGVPGTETMLPLLLTVAAGDWPHPSSEPPVPEGSFTYEHIRKLCFEHPNRIYNLGASDELTLTIDPTEKWTIQAEHLHSKCGWTPYEGWKVVGKIL